MIEILEHLHVRRGLRKLGLLSLEMGSLRGILPICLNI